jgi:hypothetical protein
MGNSPEQTFRHRLPRKLPHMTLDQICGAPLNPPRAKSSHGSQPTPQSAIASCGRGVPRLLNCGSAQTRLPRPLRSPHLSQPQLRKQLPRLWLESDCHRLSWVAASWFRNPAEKVCCPKFGSHCCFATEVNLLTNGNRASLLSKRGRS